MSNYINIRRQYLDSKTVTRLEKYLYGNISKYRLLLDNLTHQLETKISKKLEDSKANCNKYIALLDSFSPLKTMTRGYSVVTLAKSGKIISKISDAVVR